MTPAPTRQMRLPLTSDAADPSPSPDRESCPRCRGTGTPIRRREVISRCVNCGLRALAGRDGVRYCAWHACSFCAGTGLVCAVCHGECWLRRPVFPVGNEAVRCGACKEASA